MSKYNIPLHVYLCVNFGLLLCVNSYQENKYNNKIDEIKRSINENKRSIRLIKDRQNIHAQLFEDIHNEQICKDNTK